jgi:hypothetical protein
MPGPAELPPDEEDDVDPENDAPEDDDDVEPLPDGGTDPALEAVVQLFPPSSEQQDRGSGYVWAPASHAWNGAPG